MAVKIFFCYAHEDEALLKKLKTHLRPLQRQGYIDVWHDRDISAGAEWEREINEHLNAAQMILLLVSPDFMDSDYCYGIEMKRAVERHQRGEACVIPIILRPVHWQEEPLDMLQALPTDAKPVKSWLDLDEALFNIVGGLRKVIKQQWLKKSNVYCETGFYDEALQAISQAIRLDAYDAQSYKAKGKILYKLEQYKDALAAFDEAIRLDPNNAQIYGNKGLLLNELRRFEDALEACERAIKLDSRYAPAYYTKAWTLHQLERYQEALDAYEQVTRINPDNLEAHKNKGQVLYILKQYEDALVAYQQAAELNPLDTTGLANAKGMILRELGRDEEAIREKCRDGDQYLKQLQLGTQGPGLRCTRQLSGSRKGTPTLTPLRIEELNKLILFR